MRSISKRSLQESQEGYTLWCLYIYCGTYATICFMESHFIATYNPLQFTECFLHRTLQKNTSFLASLIPPGMTTRILEGALAASF
jgi:hypothetical protein